MPAKPKFPELHQFKTPPGFSAAVSTAAEREFCTNSEFIRRAVFDRLRSVGVAIGPLSSPAPAASRQVGKE